MLCGQSVGGGAAAETTTPFPAPCTSTCAVACLARPALVATHPSYALPLPSPHLSTLGMPLTSLP